MLYDISEVVEKGMKFVLLMFEMKCWDKFVENVVQIGIKCVEDSLGKCFDKYSVVVDIFDGDVFEYYVDFFV